MKTLAMLLVILFVTSCAAVSPKTAQQYMTPPPQEIIIKIQGVDAVKVEDDDSDGITRAMEVANPEGQLSRLSFISGGKAFIKIFSGLSVADVTMLWNDLVVLEETTPIRDICLFINSGGGDAFSGLALADQIERARLKGFKFTAHASGIIASAAVPVFASCDVRLAAEGTIFMVHEASIFQWGGTSSHSDIKSTNKLMDMLRDRYLEKLVKHSKISKDEWEELEGNTTWFSAQEAKDKFGIVDSVE